MLFEFESVTPTITTTTTALIAAVVTFTFYFCSLFSVYHRNHEYEEQKIAEVNNKTINKIKNKCEIKSKCPISAFMNSNDGKEMMNGNDTNKSESKSKCPTAAFTNTNDGKTNGNCDDVTHEFVNNNCPAEIGNANNDEFDSNGTIKNENTTEKKKANHFKKMGGMFDSNAIISSRTEKNKNKKKTKLQRVENLGCITLKELNKYTCDHERRLLSIFGTIYDVSEATEKYGKDGVYKEFAGHDITLCLGAGKLNDKWLDRFVSMEPKHRECANSWIDFYHKQYPIAGILEKWSENTRKWPKLTQNELNELNAECIIM